MNWKVKTYAGINGGGNWPPGRPCGAPGPGRFGIAGAARFVAGGGGGPRPTPYINAHGKTKRKKCHKKSIWGERFMKEK